MSKADNGGYVKPDYWRRQALPEECERRIARQREKEKNLVPLVIDARTTIYVTPEKCNEAYAEEFRRKCDSVKAGDYGVLDVRW